MSSRARAFMQGAILLASVRVVLGLMTVFEEAQDAGLLQLFLLPCPPTLPKTGPYVGCSKATTGIKGYQLNTSISLVTICCYSGMPDII